MECLELVLSSENRMAGANIKPCLCMANADDDDVVMHDADCTYLDDSLLEVRVSAVLHT